MAYVDDLSADVRKMAGTNFSVRNGILVPSTDTVLMNQAVRVQATYLYADLAGSSDVAHKLNPAPAATVIRTYLRAASSIVQHFGGAIRSYDGDRVMGIFMGADRDSLAIRAALGINWAVLKLVRPELLAVWPTLEQHYVMNHAVGISGGEALIVKAGVWGNNDLISIGAAPNVAAKLSDRRSGNYQTYITYDVMEACSMETTVLDGVNMWRPVVDELVGGSRYKVFGSNYWWRP